jgi:hypothetical protein
MDAHEFLIEFHDHLAPKLDPYEQSIYLYVVRHSRLQAEIDAVIGFKSARKKIALGTGKSGVPLSDKACYDKLKSLASKGCLEITGSERQGTRVAPKLPHEISGLIPDTPSIIVRYLELEDFFSSPEQRMRIFTRDESKCFYCLCELNQDNFVVEHVVSRPRGQSNYRNVVAACRRCNNRKGDTTALDFLRLLLREALLSDSEFEDRREMLERLARGDLKPPMV